MAIRAATPLSASVNNDVFDGLTSCNGDGSGGDTVDYSHTPG